jgi:hypothetical protein
MIWLSVAAGALLVVATWASVIVTVVLPRGHFHWQLPAIAINRLVRDVFVAFAHLGRSYEAKDAILSPIAPIALIAQLLTWLALFALGFTLMAWPASASFAAAARTVLAGLFTLGIIGGLDGGREAIVYGAAASGAIVIALQIAYLPAIYAAFHRRENLVALLESRAGAPAWGPEVLIRHQLVGITDTLPQLYEAWESWAAAVSESHTSYPVLLLFRSPEPWHSWVLSLLAVLDAAAMHLALCPKSAPSQARLCVRMGFTALRRIASSLGWWYEPDPSPDARIELNYESFEAAVAMLLAAGFPIERSVEEAWIQFRGWRVNYEALAYRLADRVVAPPAPWSGARTQLRGVVVMPQRPDDHVPAGNISPESLWDRLDWPLKP